ncbi:MAG: SAM-dependent methyltransferase [Trueperaceae bacterium]|nr:MAG: SAM-dependent methyltransferase [Trueperaceae bacterium]
MDTPSVPPVVATAVAARSHLTEGGQATAYRLCNGHLEGDPRFVIDAYGTAAVIYHQAAPDDDPGALDAVVTWLPTALPWLRAVVVKERPGASDEARRGRVAWKSVGAVDGATSTTAPLPREVLEHGVRYAVDLLMHQDAGLYLDTRLLRRWLIDTSEGLSVLNTFAYTGSLGVAARAGGATRVLHTDLKARYLDVARASYALNGFVAPRADFQARDFWSFVKGARLRGERFDRVILDPPFYASTDKGTVDLNRDTIRLINKVRPLVRSGGSLVVVNNALFLPGVEFMRELEALCAGGWLEIERVIGVPDDVTGYPSTRVGAPPVDPGPFAHSTKIVVLTVRHKA